MKTNKIGRAGAAAAVIASVAAALFFSFPAHAGAERSEEASAAVAGVASDGMLIPIGRTAGIKIFSSGVIVVELSKIETAQGPASPAEKAGIKKGDIIISVNGKQTNSIEALQKASREAGDKTVPVVVNRGGKTLKLEIKLAKDAADGAYKLGAWVRDSMAGIGTITFYDPETGVFGSLGHGICDGDTGVMIPLSSGCLIPATISGIKKGLAGKPGELIGAFEPNRESGELFLNGETGLFGKIAESELYPELFGGKPIPIAPKEEVLCQKAEILSNIEGGEVKSYEIEIVKILDENRSTKNMQIRVTDDELLAKTGGIVQGMSGSPIIQNGRIIGAVTHVLVGDPTSGYAIYIENMLNSANSIEKYGVAA